MTGKQRIVAAMRRHGHVTQTMFDRPTIDGMEPPIRQIARRIGDLRKAGYEIKTHDPPDAETYWELLAEPVGVVAATSATSPVPPRTSPAAVTAPSGSELFGIEEKGRPQSAIFGWDEAA
jgi:hypothetical protein